MLHSHAWVGTGKAQLRCLLRRASSQAAYAFEATVIFSVVLLSQPGRSCCDTRPYHLKRDNPLVIKQASYKSRPLHGVGDAQAHCPIAHVLSPS